MIHFKTLAALLLSAMMCSPVSAYAQVKRNTATKGKTTVKKSIATRSTTSRTTTAATSKATTGTKPAASATVSRPSTPAKSSVSTNMPTKTNGGKKTAPAQEILHSYKYYVGGSVSYNTHSYDGKTDRSSFNFSPEIGMVINEDWSVGVSLGYSSSTNYQTTGNLTSSTLSIEPYARKTFVRRGKLGVFCEGYIRIARDNNQTLVREEGEDVVRDNKFNGFGLGVRPGISYRFTDRISLVAIMGGLSYSSSKRDDNNAKSNSSIYFSLTNRISFGALYNF